MNYNIKLCGRKSLTGTMNNIVKLIIESVSASDYVTRTYAHPLLAPHSTLMLEMDVIGSSKKEVIKIVLDCDCSYVGYPVDLHLTPDALDIERTNDLLHYWGIIGALFKIIPDLSPAYITSYLLDNKMNQELALFKQYSNVSLPIPVQEVMHKLGAF